MTRAAKKKTPDAAVPGWVRDPDIYRMARAKIHKRGGYVNPEAATEALYTTMHGRRTDALPNPCGGPHEGRELADEGELAEVAELALVYERRELPDGSHVDRVEAVGAGTDPHGEGPARLAAALAAASRHPRAMPPKEITYEPNPVHPEGDDIPPPTGLYAGLRAARIAGAKARHAPAPILIEPGRYRPAAPISAEDWRVIERAFGRGRPLTATEREEAEEDWAWGRTHPDWLDHVEPDKNPTDAPPAAFTVEVRSIQKKDSLAAWRADLLVTWTEGRTPSDREIEAEASRQLGRPVRVVLTENADPSRPRRLGQQGGALLVRVQKVAKNPTDAAAPAGYVEVPPEAPPFPERLRNLFLPLTPAAAYLRYLHRVEDAIGVQDPKSFPLEVVDGYMDEHGDRLHEAFMESEPVAKVAHEVISWEHRRQKKRAKKEKERAAQPNPTDAPGVGERLRHLVAPLTPEQMFLRYLRRVERALRAQAPHRDAAELVSGYEKEHPGKLDASWKTAEVPEKVAHEILSWVERQERKAKKKAAPAAGGAS